MLASYLNAHEKAAPSWTRLDRPIQTNANLAKSDYGYTDGMHEKPGKPRWRPRFTLLGLLAFTAVCALATQGHLAWQTHVARRDLQWAEMVYNEGAEMPRPGQSILELYCGNSERLCEAECRIALSDKTAARRAHLERIKQIQRREVALLPVTLGGDPSTNRKVIAKYRQRAEEMMKDSSQ